MRKLYIQAVSALNCDDDWHEFNGKCYFATTVKKSYSDNLNYCRKLNADVASIHSKKETEFLLKLTESYEHYWIGGRRIVPKKHVFGWSDGSEFNYTNWDKSSNDPNNLNERENCIIFVRDSGLWWDFPCNEPHYAFCQRTEMQQVVAKFAIEDGKQQAIVIKQKEKY
ncbi:C-type MBL-2 protein precursor-like protein [Leptotrombidium deliense]|uniref:C-type MBL-2 protein-like protein n=1 Tax=Leptotrombidium deliense TaxID=299467 RepID=A0A443RYL2_9ACAR|nr:C-type MBL-2 protein precursor-like protein [Leptotrombidium deliense]